MKITSETLRDIDEVVDKLARTFKFSYFDYDDMVQEGRMYALEALKKYDKSKPLKNFLYIVVRRKFINLKRNKLKRNENPCIGCGHKTESEMFQCKRYLGWKKRNDAKQNIINPITIDNINDENENNTRVRDYILEDLQMKEVLDIIENKLEVEERKVFLKILAGDSIHKSVRTKVENRIREILCLAD